MGWLDLLVGALLASFGVALVVVLIVGGGTLLEVALVGVFVGTGTLRWMNTSWGWEPIRRWRRRRSSQRAGQLAARRW